MKTWEIYHYTYGDVCGDSWYGKERKFDIIGIVTDTEENVKSSVERLNEKNRSYYAKEEPEDDYDENYVDEDYISYRELKIVTLKEIENRYIR